MKFSVVSLFPELIEVFSKNGVIGQAHKSGLLFTETINPRLYTKDLHKTVDDRPYGGGDGMILLAEPLSLAIEELKKNAPQAPVIYLSPQGKPLTDQKVRELSGQAHLILVCGRYGGVDQRWINSYVDEEISIGDYVLSGGELGACVLIDAVGRMVPGVLGHAESSDRDSFSGGLLEAPNFTKPRVFNDQEVPEILLSGHHQKIDEWRYLVSLLVTLQKRPDLAQNNRDFQSKISQLKDFYQAMSEAEKKALGLQKIEGI